MAEKEYIEREALLKRLLSISVVADDMYGMGINRGLERAETQIEMMPAADVVEVRHARWKDNHCTACGMMPMGEEIWDSCEFAPPKFEFFMDFCPCCGAKMDGGKPE